MVFYVGGAVFIVIAVIVWLVLAGRHKGGGMETRQAREAHRNACPEAETIKATCVSPGVPQELREKLLQTERKLWEAEEAAAPYEKLFEGMALPLQKLLGLAHCPWQSMSKEKADYYIWDVVTNPLLDAVKRAKGKIEQGNLCLPKPEKPFEEEKVRQDIQQLSERQVQQYIRENELQISSREIAFQKTGAVRELGIVVKTLEDFARDRQATEDDLKKQAQNVQSILERHGIYPMFAKDGRLNPKLRKRFSPANEYSIKYPGLFIKREGGWEVLGANIGMDDAE